MKRRVTIEYDCPGCDTKAVHSETIETDLTDKELLIFGSAPSVLDRWWSSKGSPLPRYNFVLHLWSPLPHETTLHSNKTLRASPRSVTLRLIAEPISSSGFLRHSLRNIFSL
ncbi:MAG: hypothetical protein WAR24_09690 [Candidatus Acidiferrales bacterium]